MPTNPAPNLARLNPPMPFPLRSIGRAAQHAYVIADATCTNECCACGKPTGTWEADVCGPCARAGEVA